MKTEKFLRAMTDIDEKFIKEADIFAPVPLSDTPRGSVFYRIVGAAACAVLVCGIAVFGGRSLLQSSYNSGSAQDCGTAETETTAGAAAGTADGAVYDCSSTSDGNYTSEEYEIDTASMPNPSDIHELCSMAQIAVEDFWTEKLSAAEIHIDLNEIFATHKSLSATGDGAYEYDGVILRTRNIPDMAAVDSEAAEEAEDEYFLKLERDGNDWTVTDIQSELTSVVIPDDWESVEWVVSRNDDGTVSVSDTYDTKNRFVRYITRTVENSFELNVLYDENDRIFHDLLNVAADSAKNYLGDLCQSNADLAALFLSRVEITQLDKDDYDRMIAKFYFDVRLSTEKEYTGDINEEVTTHSGVTRDWYTVERTVKIYREDGEWRCVGVNEMAEINPNYYTTYLVKHVDTDFTPTINGSTEAETPMPADTAEAYNDFEG